MEMSKAWGGGTRLCPAWPEPRHWEQEGRQVHFQSLLLIWASPFCGLWKCSWRCTLSGKICYKYKTDAKGLRNIYKE